MARDEKTKEHQHSKEHRVYKAGDKYVCEECGAEVTFEADKCPSCSVNLNWAEITKNVRYG